jgi:hypothetical protein
LHPIYIYENKKKGEYWIEIEKHRVAIGIN